MSDVTIDALYNELLELKQDVNELKSRIDEDFELSDWAKDRLESYEHGTKTVSHEDIKKKLSA